MAISHLIVRLCVGKQTYILGASHVHVVSVVKYNSIILTCATVLLWNADTSTAGNWCLV